jgi:hypothetical protein
MKHCPKCSKNRPWEFFTKNMARHDGRDYWCRLCRKAYRDAHKPTETQRARRREVDKAHRLEATLARPEKCGLLTDDQRFINAVREMRGLEPLYQRAALEALRRPGAMEPHMTSWAGGLAPGCRWIKAAL